MGNCRVELGKFMMKLLLIKGDIPFRLRRKPFSIRINANIVGSTSSLTGKNMLISL